jgi:hypothetical protein
VNGWGNDVKERVGKSMVFLGLFSYFEVYKGFQIMSEVCADKVGVVLLGGE